MDAFDRLRGGIDRMNNEDAERRLRERSRERKERFYNRERYSDLVESTFQSDLKEAKTEVEFDRLTLALGDLSEWQEMAKKILSLHNRRAQRRSMDEVNEPT